jgi:hypothetical protein
MATTPSEIPAEADAGAAIDVEIDKAIKKLGGGTDVLLAASDYSTAELLDVLRKLGGKSDILGLVGSYGDTLDDQEVVDGVRRWNSKA